MPARFFCAQNEKIGRKKPCRTAGASRSRGIRDDCRGDRFSLFSVNKENRRRLKRYQRDSLLGGVRAPCNRKIRHPRYEVMITHCSSFFKRDFEFSQIAAGDRLRSHWRAKGEVTGHRKSYAAAWHGSQGGANGITMRVRRRVRGLRACFSGERC